MSSDSKDEQRLKDEIVCLEDELANARSRLKGRQSKPAPEHTQALNGPGMSTLTLLKSRRLRICPASNISHTLLLLSDSALPLGSFAFSSGLESYLAHHRGQKASGQSTVLPSFVALSLSSLASSNIPYILAAYRNPIELFNLDDELDACILCPVARRASLAQGRALLTLWQRSLKHGCSVSEASTALRDFGTEMLLSNSRESTTMTSPPSQDFDNPGIDGANQTLIHGHFSLIWSVVCAAMDIPQYDCVYTFLLNHAKAVTSAGVRAGIVGPYAAQQLLASEWLRSIIRDVMETSWNVGVEDAAQSVPMMDVWIGRHDLLYSRIFNS